MEIKQLLHALVDNDGSDLHIKYNAYPMLRIDGSLRALPGSDILTKVDSEKIVLESMTDDQKQYFEKNLEIDYAISLGDIARFRVNAYTQRGSVAAVYRLIPSSIRSISDLGLPNIFYKLAALKSGLVLVVGPTGHGKSSSLAAILEEINRTRSENIITIEDPIEYVYQNKKSIISQREIGNDTHSFKVAMKSVLREDPNVVLVGEMRDYETIASALTIAETGHLVFATLHTSSASQTVDRIVDVFPAHQQNQVRMQLASSLEAVISQRLLPAIGGGRVAVVEAMLGTSAIKTNIREGKSHLIDNIIQTSQESGMIPLETYMAELVKKKRLSLEIAQLWALRPNDLMRHVNSKN